MAIVSANGAAAPLSPNYIINGAFDIWQRSTSTTALSDGAYVAPDRFKVLWATGGTATGTWSRQTFTPGSALVSSNEGTYYSRLSATSGSSTTEIGLGQWVENVRTFGGQTITVSFWAKADSARTLTISIKQRFGTGGSAAVEKSTTQAITSTWARYSFTTTLDSISGKTINDADSALSLLIWLGQGQASGSPVLDMWGIQIENGSVATPFRRNANSLQGELAACQRYYQTIASGNTASIAIATMYNSTTAIATFPLPVTMRTVPAIDQTTGSTYYAMDYAGTGLYGTSLSLSGQSSKSVLRLDMTTSGGTAGYSGFLRTNSPSAYLAVSAEL